jgi:hypothetical protein
VSSLSARLVRLEDAARRRSRREVGYHLVLILRPGDPDPEIPEGCRPLVIDCRDGSALPDPFPPGLVIDAQDLGL